MTSGSDPLQSSFQSRVERALAERDPAEVLRRLIVLGGDPATAASATEDDLRLMASAGMDAACTIASGTGEWSATLVRLLIDLARICVNADLPQLKGPAVFYCDTAAAVALRLGREGKLQPEEKDAYSTHLAELYERLGRPDMADKFGGRSEVIALEDDGEPAAPAPSVSRVRCTLPHEPASKSESDPDDDEILMLDSVDTPPPAGHKSDTQATGRAPSPPAPSPAAADDDGPPPMPMSAGCAAAMSEPPGPDIAPEAAFGKPPGVMGGLLRKLGRGKSGGERDEDLVNCGVFAPPTTEPGDLVFVQAFVFLPEHADEAARMAKEFDGAARRRGVKTLDVTIPRPSKLTFHLVVPGMTVDDPVQSVTWRGTTQSAQFCVNVPDDMRVGTAVGTLTVSLGSVPIGCIKFKLEVAAEGTPGATLAEAVPSGVAASKYRQAFVSYASADRAEVLKRIQMLNGVGIHYFQDVLDLEPGEAWEKTIRQRIAECDLFLLFWSSSARQSEWVHKEIEAALARKAGDETNAPDIVPVIIEGPPIVEPPPALAHLHFNDRLLYFMS